MTVDPDTLTLEAYHRLTRRPKYGNKKVEIDGIMFDGQREATRFRELSLLQKAGQIAELTVHPKWTFVVNGVLVGSYRADFSYSDMQTYKLVVEDVKSEPTKTQAYRLRKKLMLACHGLEITEVE